MNRSRGHIMHEITPLSDKDCFYIADRRKSEFTYPLHSHSEFEIKYIENAEAVRRNVGDSEEVIGKYDRLSPGRVGACMGAASMHLETHQGITIQFSKDLFGNFIHKNQFDSIGKCSTTLRKESIFRWKPL